MPEPDLLTSGREREPGIPRGRARLAAVLVVGLLVVGLLAGGGVLLLRPPAGPGTPAATPSRPAGQVVGQVPPAPQDGPTGAAPTMSVVGDLTTTVSVGHVRSTAVDGDAHPALVEQALRTTVLGAHFVLAPQPGSTALAPKGLEVLFDRRLDDAAARAFDAAVESLPASTAFVTEEAGTAVDVSAPLVPGGPCTPTGAPGSEPGTGGVPDPAFGRWFPLFELTTADGRLVLSYTGPAKTVEQLTQTASFLARLCGVGIGEVRVAPRAATAG